MLLEPIGTTAAYADTGGGWDGASAWWACRVWTSAAQDQVHLHRPHMLLGFWTQVSDIRSVPLPRGWSWDEFDFSLGSHEIVKAGWPLPCLSSERRSSLPAQLSPGGGGRHWALKVRAPRHPTAGPATLDGTLPCRPLWRGLISNTIAFGAVWGLVMLGAKWVWRQRPSVRRRRRGWCVRCGYDLLGDFANGCPECGWNRTNVSRPQEEQRDSGANAERA